MTVQNHVPHSGVGAIGLLESLPQVSWESKYFIISHNFCSFGILFLIISNICVAILNILALGNSSFISYHVLALNLFHLLSI